MTMRYRLLGLLVAVVAVASGCGGDDAATHHTPTSSENPTSSPVAVEAWEQSTATLVTAGIVTQSNIPAEVPQVQAIGSTSHGYLVAGSVNGGFTVWRSGDLESFEPVYSEVCCERYLHAWSIAEFAGSVLIGGTGEFGIDRTEQAFILRSDDGGASWTLIEDPLFTSDANRVNRMIVTDDAVLVETVDDREHGAQPQSVAAWSDDLTTWRPVELPGRRLEDWPRFVQSTETVFAVTQRYDGPEGRFSSWVIWRSDDGGRRFVEASTLVDADIGGFLAIGDTLVAVPSTYQHEYRHVDVRGLMVLDGKGEWRELEPDTGTWGDGSVTVYPTVASGPSGRTYAMVSRIIRASVHYCYDDVDSCQQRENALLVTEDGMTWHDVAGFPAAEGLHGGPMLLTTDLAGNISVLAASEQDRQIRITRWTAGSPPPVVENPDYPPPDITVALYDYEQSFDVGDERRYPLGLGGCWGMNVDDQRWEPDSPLPDSPPSTWQFRPVPSADGPQGYVYGHIHRVASDTIKFSIEGIGPVATFHPAPPLEDDCD